MSSDLDAQSPERVHHVLHPDHPLTLSASPYELYLCNGCKTPGKGTRYRCNLCSFDLHEYCAKCPTTCSSFMHPQHQLTLQGTSGGRNQNQNQNALQVCICNVCGDQVKGLFFSCELCSGFYVHPLCTRFPQHVFHVLHPDHPLTLQPSSSPTLCTVCTNPCTSWSYRCRSCGVEFHLECLLPPSDHASTATQRSPLPQGQPARPAYGGQYYWGPPPPAYGGQYYWPPPPPPPPVYYGHYVNQGQGGVVPAGGEKPTLGTMIYAILEKLGIGVVSNSAAQMLTDSFS